MRRRARFPSPREARGAGRASRGDPARLPVRASSHQRAARPEADAVTGMARAPKASNRRRWRGLGASGGTPQAPIGDRRLTFKLRRY
jgi:hypothetical protein